MKACKDCSNFIPNTDFTELSDNRLTFGRCKKFQKNKVEITDYVRGIEPTFIDSYQHASTCRQFVNMCGPEAKLFEPLTEVKDQHDTVNS